MFSTLNDIFAVQKPRQAESTDARLGIRRQDPDEQQSKNSKDDDTGEMFSEEDSATVSIDALHAFLESFLKSIPASSNSDEQLALKETQKHSSGIAVGRDFNQKRPVSGNVAHAMGAYKSAAKGSTTQETQRFSVNEAKQAGENLGLQASEVREIHQLLEDLKALSEQNIQMLTIERSASFLQGLINAVEKLKHG